MRAAKYIGRRKELCGRTALVREAPGRTRILVQFDSADKDVSNDPLCYGWHDFAADEFQIEGDE